MELEKYLQNIPLLHSWDGGVSWNTGGFDRHHLRCMIDTICSHFSEARIVETGAGNSTISFLFCNPKEVVSICPVEDVFQRIYDFCKYQSIPATRLRSVIGKSEWELPEVAKNARRLGLSYDFALIDGCHGWPAVFVDFCYMNSLTEKNSLIMLDDIELHSVRELGKFLLEQPGFALIKDLGRAWIFQKTSAASSLPWWGAQPYIVRKSIAFGTLDGCDNDS